LTTQRNKSSKLQRVPQQWLTSKINVVSHNFKAPQPRPLRWDDRE
jgi:hypothetical protein